MTTLDARYNPPELRDYGTLVDLTADFDLHFLGSIAQVVTMAAISNPIVDPGGGGGTDPPGGGTDPTGGGGNNPTGNTPTDTVTELTSDSSDPTDPGSGTAGAGTDVPAETAGAADKLPFTGFPAFAVAVAGATLTATGAAVRTKLRRRG